MKIYIATAFTNQNAYREAADRVLGAGHTITYDWTQHDELEATPEQMPDIAKADLNAVRRCDALLMIMPAGRGSHVELGAALAWEKPVYIVGDDDGPYPCPFHHYRRVRRVATVEKVLRWLA